MSINTSSSRFIDFNGKKLVFPSTEGAAGASLTTDGAVDPLLQALSWVNHLPLAGGTLTGSLTLNADPTDALHAATKQYVDNISVTPVVISWKEPVVAATTGFVSDDASLTGPLVGDPVLAGTLLVSGVFELDGVSIADGDRILVKDNTMGITNAKKGIYVVDITGTDLTLTRSSDANAWSELVSAVVVVSEGTENGDRTFVCTVNDGGTLGTNDVTFQALSASVNTATPFTTGVGGSLGIVSIETDAGLSMTTGIISINTSIPNGLTFSSGELQVAIDPALGGLELDTDGLKLLLEATDPTLEIDVNNAVKVKYDVATGLTQGTNGLAINVDGSTVVVNNSDQLEAKTEVRDVEIIDLSSLDITNGYVVLSNPPINISATSLFVYAPSQGASPNQIYGIQFTICENDRLVFSSAYVPTIGTAPSSGMLTGDVVLTDTDSLVVEYSYLS